MSLCLPHHPLGQHYRAPTGPDALALLHVQQFLAIDCPMLWREIWTMFCPLYLCL